MKSTIISMSIVLIVMVAVPMIFLGEGNLAEKFGFGGFSGFGEKSESPTKLPENVKSVTTREKVEVYTWIDASGVKHFTDTPPPDGGVSVKIVLKPNTNVISAIKIPKEEEKVVSKPKVYSVGNPYTPGGVKEVIDNSKDIQNTMEQREEDREKMMQDLFPQMSGN